MNKNGFRKLLSYGHDQMLALTASKGEEYSGGDDQLANFKRYAAAAGISLEQAWLVLFMKHIDAISSHARTGVVLSEPIDGRIDDAMLYLHLYRAIVWEKLDPTKTDILPC